MVNSLLLVLTFGILTDLPPLSLFPPPPAQTMVDLVKGRSSVDEFALAMDETLGEFEFPDDFVIDVWTAVESAKKS